MAPRGVCVSSMLDALLSCTPTLSSTATSTLDDATRTLRVHTITNLLTNTNTMEDLWGMARKCTSIIFSPISAIYMKLSYILYYIEYILSSSFIGSRGSQWQANKQTVRPLKRNFRSFCRVSATSPISLKALELVFTLSRFPLIDTGSRYNSLVMYPFSYFTPISVILVAVSLPLSILSDHYHYHHHFDFLSNYLGGFLLHVSWYCFLEVQIKDLPQ